MPSKTGVQVLRNESEVAVLEGISIVDLHCGLTPDGSRFYAVCKDRKVRLWETNSWRELIAIATKSVPDELRMTPDRDTMIVGFADGTTEIWNSVETDVRL